jgi:hypothetical protein
VLGGILGRRGLQATAADSGWVEGGVSLGSNESAALKPPRVLLAWDVPTDSLSAGWARYALERRFQQPVTIVRFASLPRVDLRRFDVIVLPSGDYADSHAEAAGRIKDWVRAGGTLVTLGDASRWAVREKVGLLDTTALLRDGRPDLEPAEKDEGKKDAKPPDEARPFDLEQALRPDREAPESTPGALVRVSLDADHWLSAGSDGEVQAVVEGRRVFTPMKLDKGTNEPHPRRLVAGGHAWDEARSLLAQRAFLMEQPLGAGHVVAFAEDPNYRALSEATELLFRTRCCRPRSEDRTRTPARGKRAALKPHRSQPCRARRLDQDAGLRGGGAPVRRQLPRLHRPLRDRGGGRPDPEGLRSPRASA